VVVAVEGRGLQIICAQRCHGAADGEGLLQLQKGLLDVIWGACTAIQHSLIAPFLKVALAQHAQDVQQLVEVDESLSSTFLTHAVTCMKSECRA